MRLTDFTEFTLRTLMYLGQNRDRLVTTQDIAEVYGISRNHLVKVVQHLGAIGLVESTRGRNGGLRLKVEPKDINIGKVVRGTETDFMMAECFDRATNQCLYSKACGLQDLLHSATAAYLTTLNDATLESVLKSTGAQAGKSTCGRPMRKPA